MASPTEADYIEQLRKSQRLIGSIAFMTSDRKVLDTASAHMSETDALLARAHDKQEPRRFSGEPITELGRL